MPVLLRSSKLHKGYVEGTRNNFKIFFDAYGDKVELNKPVPQEKKNLLKGFANSSIKINQFSDFVMAHVSLAPNENAKLPVRGVYGLVMASASTMLINLAAGNPVRGGVDVGVSLEMSNDEIYGASIARAYTLESKIANYPRIVVGDECIDYLQQISENNPRNEIDIIAKLMAESIQAMIVEDVDGYKIIDYLGQAAKDQLIGSYNYDLISKAYEFVTKTSQSFQKKRNSKVAFKYCLLKDYIESRLHIWKV